MIVTVFTSIEVVVTVLDVGAALTSAPVPFAIALAVIIPDGVTGEVAPVMFAAGIVVGRVMFVVVVLTVVGLPVMVMVATVPLVRCAAAAVNPAGNPETAKLAGVMLVAYVPLVRVYVIVAFTVSLTFRLSSPVPAIAMAAETGAASCDMFIVLLGKSVAEKVMVAVLACVVVLTDTVMVIVASPIPELGEIVIHPSEDLTLHVVFDVTSIVFVPPAVVKLNALEDDKFNVGFSGFLLQPFNPNVNNMAAIVTAPKNTFFISLSVLND